MSERDKSNRSYSEEDQKETFQFEIISHLGSLGTTRSGWKRELNVVSWNGRPPRLDIRDWNPDHTKMGRGVGLNGVETENMIALLQGFDGISAGI